MQVAIEPGPDNGFGTQYRLRVLSGYRAGELVRSVVPQHPVFDIDANRLREWAEETGYVVQPGIQEAGPQIREVEASQIIDFVVFSK